MSRPCSICKHEKRPEIDAMLKDKTIKLKEISDAYSISEAMLQIHRRNHLKIVFFRNRKKSQGTFGPASPVISQKEILSSLTQSQRIQIRDFLDQNFDDEKGIYKHNLSDQLVGEKLNIPWKHIFNMREIAYGPIIKQESKPQNPMILHLEKIIKDLSNFLEELKTKEKNS